ncbi:hypothetical protein JCM6882_001792 [Rhodosporidiobolus microsporus]
MLRTAALVAVLAAGPALSHMTMWSKSMYGVGENFAYDVPGQPCDPIGPDLTTQDSWWFRGPEYRALTPMARSDGEVTELPAGGSINIEIACHVAWTSFGVSPTVPGSQLDACPGNAGAYHSGDPNADDIDPSLVAGCALAIADKDDIEQVGWDDLTIFSVQQDCVKQKVTSFDIPAKMPSCTGDKCICGWFWLANNGTANFYMTGFDCKVTNSPADALPIAAPQDPVWCGDDPSTCTKGAKRPLYAYDLPTNVPIWSNDDRPGYHEACHRQRYKLERGWLHLCDIERISRVEQLRRPDRVAGREQQQLHPRSAFLLVFQPCGGDDDYDEDQRCAVDCAGNLERRADLEQPPRFFVFFLLVECGADHDVADHYDGCSGDDDDCEDDFHHHYYHATATASSEWDTSPASAVKDGKLGGYISDTEGDESVEWSSYGEGVGAWVTLKWATPVVFNQIVLFDRPNTVDQVTAGTVTFADGKAVSFGTLENTGKVGTSLNFTTPITTNSIKVLVTGVSSSTQQSGFSEIQVFLADVAKFPTATRLIPTVPPVVRAATTTTVAPQKTQAPQRPGRSRNGKNGPRHVRDFTKRAQEEAVAAALAAKEGLTADDLFESYSPSLDQILQDEE